MKEYTVTKEVVKELERLGFNIKEFDDGENVVVITIIQVLDWLLKTRKMFVSPLLGCNTKSWDVVISKPRKDAVYSMEGTLVECWNEGLLMLLKDL